MAGSIHGKIVEISTAGDLVTDIAAEQLGETPRDESVRILVDEEHETFGIFPVDHGQPSMTLIAIAPSDGPLRLHLVGDSASMMLGVRPGASVQIQW